MPHGKLRRHAILGVLLAALVAPAAAFAAFSSGSNGSDGALNYTGQSGTKTFDPATINGGIDDDGDNVYHFTTITIPSGVTLQLRANKMRKPGPVYFLASGAVTIAGVLDLNGNNGHGCGELHQASVPGPGGYAGGIGGRVLNGVGGPGDGPGGGAGGFQSINANSRYGAGGSFQTRGGSGGLDLIDYPQPGPAYGNLFLIPLVGGSGGGGAAGNAVVGGGGGGAGAGAILLASTVSVNIPSGGAIYALGGAANTTGCAGTDYGYGAGGAGGAVYIMAPEVTGTGAIYAYSQGGAYSGGTGWIRIDTLTPTIPFSISPALSYRNFPVVVLMPTDVTERTIRVKSVAGINVPANPSGGYAVPDVAIATASPVPVVIEAENVPVGTQPVLYISSTDDDDQTITATALAGTLASSSSTTNVTFPSGGSTVFVKATWTP